MDSFLSLFLLESFRACLGRSWNAHVPVQKLVHSLRPCLLRREVALGNSGHCRWAFQPYIQDPHNTWNSFKHPVGGAMGTRMLALVRHADDVPERRDWGEGMNEPKGALEKPNQISHFPVHGIIDLERPSLKRMRAFLEASRWNRNHLLPIPSMPGAYSTKYLATEPCASARLSGRSS